MTGPGRGGERPTRHQSPRKMEIPPVRHQSEEDNKTPACGVHDRIHEGVHVAGCRLRGLGRRWAPVGAATDNMPGQGVHDAIMNPLHDGSDAADDEAIDSEPPLRADEQDRSSSAGFSAQFFTCQQTNRITCGRYRPRLPGGGGISCAYCDGRSSPARLRTSLLNRPDLTSLRFRQTEQPREKKRPCGWLS